jgi:hypothetical protein
MSQKSAVLPIGPRSSSREIADYINMNGDPQRFRAQLFAERVIPLPNPLIYFRRCNGASYWLMRAQGACSDLSSF